MLELASPLILPMTADDVDAVHGLATVCFTTPWDRTVFAEELERSWAHLRVLRPSANEPVVAFLSFWLVRDEIHVLNLGTHPARRRTGYARLLLEDMLSFARQRRVRHVSLEVRQSNLPALRLYVRLGFEPIGVRPGYYADSGEDAVVMLLTL